MTLIARAKRLVVVTFTLVALTILVSKYGYLRRESYVTQDSHLMKSNERSKSVLYTINERRDTGAKGKLDGSLVPAVPAVRLQKLQPHTAQLSIPVPTHLTPTYHKHSLENCWQMLDKVIISNVTKEGKSFTDEQLDITQYEDQAGLIPKIIHQTWDTYNIPEIAVPWVKSLLLHHPDWQYWFWTQNDVKCYLRHHYPDYVKLYNSYYSTIFKTDVMRYFLLYDYGGIYLDLDVQCLKPLDIWTHLAPAVLSHETYEHSFVMHQLKEPNVMTTVLASKPHHPYYKMLQENLERYHKLKPADVLHSTGPYYLNDIYQLYKHKHNESNYEDILVIHSKYWLPTHDRMDMAGICSCPLLQQGQLVKKNGAILRNTSDVLQLCAKARRQNFKNIADRQSYLDHHWVHTNLKKSTFKTQNTVSMFDIFPQLIPVSKRLGLHC